MLTDTQDQAAAGTDWPADDTLRGAMDHLDPEQVLAACLEALPDGEHGRSPSWDQCRVIEALYHPGRYVRVAYAFLPDASVPAARYWPEGELAYLHHPVRRPVSRRGVPVSLAGHPFELYRFPNDRRLRGLRRFTGRRSAAEAWQVWIDESTDVFRLDPDSLRRVLLRYVPEQKWIARLRARGSGAAAGDPGKRSVAVRSASVRVCEALTLRHMSLAKHAARDGSRFRVPGVVGACFDRGLLAVEWVRGKTLLEALAVEPADAVMEHIARALGAFHTAHVPCLSHQSPPDVLGRVEDACADLKQACPEVGTRLATVLNAVRRELRRASDAVRQAATLHNDFHWNQVRFCGDGVAIFDLERVCLGDPLIDVANFVTQLRMLPNRPGFDIDADVADGWARTFLDSWGRVTGDPIDSARFSCYAVLSVLELARGMMRHLRPQWRELAHTCVRAAEDRMALSRDGGAGS